MHMRHAREGAPGSLDVTGSVIRPLEKMRVGILLFEQVVGLRRRVGTTGCSWGATDAVGTEPLDYLRDVLERISIHPATRIEELLPEHWQALRQGGDVSKP
jgi:hypothetical protein